MDDMGSFDALPAVGLLLPATWHRLDLDPSTRALSIERLARRATELGPEFREARASMRSHFEQAAEIGAASGATLAYVFWSRTGAKIATASLFVALIDAESRAEAVLPDRQAFAQALAVRYAGEPAQLEAGPAARVRRRGQLMGTDGSGKRPEAEIVTWYVPHESVRRVAVLTFSTPNIALADEFGSVFDALADTLRWTT